MIERKEVSQVCNYVAIFVYKGLIDNLEVFDDKGESAAWLSTLVEEYGVDNCADSIIWDVAEKGRIDLGFVHLRSSATKETG